MLQLNSIDPAFPTLVLFNSRITYHHPITIFNPEANTITQDVVTSYSQGHYEVVRTFRVGRPNATVPDENSPLYVTNAFTAQAERGLIQPTESGVRVGWKLSSTS